MPTSVLPSLSNPPHVVGKLSAFAVVGPRLHQQRPPRNPCTLYPLASMPRSNMKILEGAELGAQKP